MVSKTNYVTVTLIMIVVLVLFQLTGISEDLLLREGENVKVDAAFSAEEEVAARDSYERLAAGLETPEGTADVGLVGKDEKCLKAAGEWCVNQKKSYSFFEDLTAAAEAEECPAMLIAAGIALEQPESGAALQDLGKRGCTVVVSGLPDTERLEESEALMDCLGIRQIREDLVELDGFKLFAGFLLGGETVYKDYSLKIPFAGVDESVKAYAVGQSEESWFLELENEELPPVIWRNHNGVGQVYVVNADFLDKKEGAGILTGIAADSADFYVYPVVNAQMSIVGNFPVLADENKDLMKRIYSQDSVAVLRDIVWPTVAGIYYDTGEQMTAMLSPRLDYEEKGELDETLADYYYKQITKMRGEIGLSGYQVSDVAPERKLAEDMALLDRRLPNYELRTFYAGGMETEEYEGMLEKTGALEDVRTVLRDYSEDEGIFSYGSGNELNLMIYMDSLKHSDEDDFRLRCIQTAYGYYATQADLSKVVYPESEEDLWNNMSERWAKYYRPYRIVFDFFDRLTATGADARTRSYLALDYEAERSGDGIVLDVDSKAEEAYFILKTHGEAIAGITGGTYEKLEKEWYLVTAREPEVEIRLEQADRSLYK